MKDKRRMVKGFLEPIKSKARRRSFCTWDVESKAGDTQEPGFTRPFLVGFYDPRRAGEVDGGYQEFRDEPHLRGRCWEERHIAPGGCVDKLMSIVLTTPYSGCVFYSHNGGNFDMLFLLAWLQRHRESDGIDFEVVPIQSTIQLLRVWRVPDQPDDPVKERWEFLDSMRLIPMGLERACRTFGLTQGKESFSLRTHEDDPRWSVYLRRDCVALAEVMRLVHDMVEDRLGGEVGITTPSTSMKLFLRRYLGRGSAPDRVPRWRHWAECDRGDACPGCAHDWIRRGYYGGRTEPFCMHGRNLRYFDINSSYAAAMREDMPCGDRYVETGSIDWRRHRSAENPDGRYSGFAECLVYIPESCPIPPLPHRDKKSGKLLFPTGYLRGVWSLEELALLRDSIVGGRIVDVRRTVWYALRPLFVEMIDELYKLRDKSRADFDAGLSELAKLLMNSLYGKFAMRQERSSVVFAQDVPEGACFLCRKPLHGRAGVCSACEGSKPATPEPDGDVWYQAHQVDAPYIIPHVSAHITALARVRLWRFMKQALETGGRLFYCDSVTADRTTIVRGPKGIEVLTFEELWVRGVEENHARDKEFRSLVGYDALARGQEAGDGWYPIERVIRHAASKRTRRVSTKHGQTQVTEDHGIVVDGKPVTPDDFVGSNMRFERVAVPPARARSRLDLHELLKDFKHERVLKKPDRVEIVRFEADSDSVFLNAGLWHKKRDEQHVRFRRYFNAGSVELAVLLRLVGAFVSDGSSSIAGVTTKSRHMLSFCKADLELQTRLRKDLELLSDATILGPMWSDTTYVVRSGTMTLAYLFAVLCGTGSKNKKLPSFVFELSESDRDVLVRALEKGDGSIDASGQLTFTTTSQKLAAGVSLLFSQHGLEHGFHFRPDKVAWTLRTRPAGSERNRHSIRDEAFESDDRYVYDLTVRGAHTFVDGIGQVLLHNTDSIITDVMLPTSTELGQLKDEYPGELLDYLAVQPKVYCLEPVWRNEESAKRRSLLEEARTSDHVDASTLGDDEIAPYSKVTMKGFPQVHRTKANLERLRAGESVAWEQLEKVRSLARAGFRRPPAMRRVEKSFQSSYDKRIVHADGSTSPIVLDERGLGWE